MAGEIDDEPAPYRLPVLRCSRAANDDRDAMLSRYLEAGRDIRRRPRQDDPGRHDLVDGRVRGIATARERIEMDASLDL